MYLWQCQYVIYACLLHFNWISTKFMHGTSLFKSITHWLSWENKVDFNLTLFSNILDRGIIIILIGFAHLFVQNTLTDLVGMLYLQLYIYKGKDITDHCFACIVISLHSKLSNIAALFLAYQRSSRPIYDQIGICILL